MTIRSWLTASLAVSTLVVSCSARASSPAPRLIVEKLAALEARVAALEDTNREYKRELDHTRAELRTEVAKNVRLANASAPIKALPPITVTHPQTPAGWTGAFWGVSAGGAATRSRTSSVERTAQLIPSNPPPFQVNGYNSMDLSGPSSNAGGFLDLFAGWDVQLSRLVLGGQLEATASDLSFSSSGTRGLTYFNSAGSTGGTSTGDYRPQVAARWMTSALLRAGVLLDDSTLLYALGGWTLARFEARNLTDNPFYQPNETFWAGGPIGGVGLERKLDSNWRIRAEYRYTRFDGAKTQDQFAWASGVINQTYSRSTQYDQNMQSGRLGFAYSFNPLK